MRSAIFLILYCLCLACTSDRSANPVVEPNIRVDLVDTSIQKILDVQERMELPALAALLGSSNPTERFLATQAFASIKDEGYVTDLAQRLRDPKPRIQQVAAYALGQQGESAAVPHLIAAFQYQDSMGANNSISETILEAVGKCGDQNVLNQLASTTTYLAQDQHLIKGQAKAIYRSMLRGITSEVGTQRMLEFFGSPDYGATAHLFAANYLSRAGVDLSSYHEEIDLAWDNILETDVRMFLAIALARTQQPAAMNTLVAALPDVSDYRLKCNIIRALAENFYMGAKRTIHRHLYDPNIQIASTAVQMIVEYGDRRFWKEYLNLSLGNYPWQVKIGLLHATNKFIPGGQQMFQKINEDLLRQRISNSRNVFERAAALRALCENPARYRYAINLYRNSDQLILRTAAIQALVGIAEKPQFAGLQANTRKEVIDIVIEALQSGDGAQASSAAGLLESATIDFSEFNIDPPKVLTTALNDLQLPRDIGTWKRLQEIRSKYGIAEDVVTPAEYSHPIAWESLSDFSDSTFVRVHTTAGDFTIKMLPNAAPGTVANFLELVGLSYFNDKVFHRVVPNFVIQGGGDRGDGYGQLDYTIRSELNQMYYDQAGYVGMASSGRHTESVQWFVTHSPTPHLDGSYTLFGQVMDGMSVVHSIQQGTTIDSLTLTR